MAENTPKEEPVYGKSIFHEFYRIWRLRQRLEQWHLTYAQRGAVQMGEQIRTGGEIDARLPAVLQDDSAR